MQNSGRSEEPDFFAGGAHNDVEYIGFRVGQSIEGTIFDMIDRRIRDVQRDCNSRLNSQDKKLESIRKDCEKKIERVRSERKSWYTSVITTLLAILTLAAAIFFK